MVEVGAGGRLSTGQNVWNLGGAGLERQGYSKAKQAAGKSLTDPEIELFNRSELVTAVLGKLDYLQ